MRLAGNCEQILFESVHGEVLFLQLFQQYPIWPIVPSDYVGIPNRRRDAIPYVLFSLVCRESFNGP